MPRVTPEPANDALLRTIESWGHIFITRPERAGQRIPYNSEGMWWPAGKAIVPNSRLKQLLARSARWHAHTAIAGFASDDLDDLLQAALSCGSAVELICKAYLASLDHSFLSERADRDSLFMLAGKHTMIPTAAASQLRSISALDAVKVIRYLHKALPIHEQDSVALRVRNSSAHMGMVDSAELRLGLIQMTRVIEVVLPLLDLDSDLFWGENLVKTVATLMDEAVAEIAKVVESKKARAHDRLDQLVKGFDPQAVAALMATLSGRFTEPSDYNQAQICPVCNQSGWLLCNVERGEPHIQADEDGGYVTQTAFPYEFECPVCDLRLQDRELLQFAFPAEIRLDDDEATPDELWEPDDLDGDY